MAAACVQKQKTPFSLQQPLSFTDNTFIWYGQMKALADNYTMLKSAGFTLLAKLLAALLNFGTIILISRFLGPAERGVCGWYLVVVAVALVFSEAIAGPTAGFLLLKHPQQAIRRVSYIWAIITAFTVTAVFFLLKKISFTEWALLFILCWLNAANALHLHLLLARQQFRLFNLLAVIMPAMVVICLLLFLKSGFLSHTAYLYSLLISWSIAFLFDLALFKPDISEHENTSVYQLIKEGFTHGFANQLGHLTDLLNSRLVFFMLPALMLGIYSNALALAEATMMIPGSMGQVMYASILNSKDVRQSNRMAVLNWWLCILVSVVILIAVLIIPDVLYQRIFGAAFSGVKPYLVCLSATLIFYSGYLVLSYWQSANGRFINNFYATLCGLIINAIITLIFFAVGKYTIMMAILALGCGLFVTFLVSIIQFFKKSRGVKAFYFFPNKSEIAQFFKK